MKPTKRAPTRTPVTGLLRAIAQPEGAGLIRVRRTGRAMVVALASRRRAPSEGPRDGHG